MRPHRRELFAGSAAVLAFSGFARHAQAQTQAVPEETYVNEVEGYGPLKPDPNGVLDLPEGFSYRIISQGGETMDDGLLVPQQFRRHGLFPPRRNQGRPGPQPRAQGLAARRTATGVPPASIRNAPA